MPKDRAPGRAEYHLQFLFPDPQSSLLPKNFLPDFAGKIRTEFIPGADVSSICTSVPPPVGKGQPLRYVSPDEDHIRNTEIVKDGYVVVVESVPMERPFNPNEFFQLPLSENTDRKTYYEFRFQGNKSNERGGLIVPADVMRYMLAVHRVGKSLDPSMIRLVLDKLGFGKEEMVIHQNSPFAGDRRSSSRFPDRIRLYLAWNTTLPIKESRIPSLRHLFFSKEHPLFRLAFLATALAIFIVIPILSLDAGLSGDDEKHYNQAIKVFRYFTEDDPSALSDPQYKLNFYGQSFDFFTYLLIRLFNLEANPYEARHVMVAIAGAATILFSGLLVRVIAGSSGGLLALFLMFLSPRFLGHSFNNTMDIPFALGNIFTLYHTILFLKKLPGISVRSAICIALGIAWTNGIRIGGFLLVPYLFMFTGLYILFRQWTWKFFSAGWWKFVLKSSGIIVLVSATGYFLSLLTWPYALQDVVNHPIQAFKVMSNIQVSIRVLYDGLIYWSDNLPWHYIPKNLIYTIPVLILLGWFASAVTWILDRKDGNGFWYFMLWFTVVFPVFFIICRKSNVYGGWRHMMFIYPSMLALSAMALSSLIRRVGTGWLRAGLVVVLVAAMVHPIRHVIRNHPNTYIYFNEWSGGINKTYGTYETDYYANSLAPASRYFIERILPGLESTPGNPVRVISNFTIGYYFRNDLDRVEPFYGRYYERGKYDWDYAILYCNYIHPYQLNNRLWPPKNTIHEIKVDDVAVAAIVERKNRDDYTGTVLFAEAMNEQDPRKLEQARDCLAKAVAYDPNNEAAILELGDVYSSMLEFEKARNTFDYLLSIYPDYDKALNSKGYSYLIEAEAYQDESLIDEAIKYINQAILSNYKFYSGYYNLGLCYGLKDDRDNAEYNFKQAIRYNARFKEAYDKLAELYDFYGESDLADQVREQSRRLP